ncbi:hypothetical protein EYF80_010086 [Liparis tanakae]|uniref:Uncharacterized protein n=1 Tax=Liparis tanakae TaxID=230148 RepID=A0A4Z2IR50_9TELE|nr:hypothetical protein EYF80_010086 [Liparis tanakae]
MARPLCYQRLQESDSSFIGPPWEETGGGPVLHVYLRRKTFGARVSIRGNFYRQHKQAKATSKIDNTPRKLKQRETLQNNKKTGRLLRLARTGSTCTAWLYRSLRTYPSWRNLGSVVQHVLVVQDPDTPWHLHSRRMPFSKTCNVEGKVETAQWFQRNWKAEEDICRAAAPLPALVLVVEALLLFVAATAAQAPLGAGGGDRVGDPGCDDGVARGGAAVPTGSYFKKLTLWGRAVPASVSELELALVDPHLDPLSDHDDGVGSALTDRPLTGGQAGDLITDDARSQCDHR